VTTNVRKPAGSDQNEYVLGTHDEEIVRLGLQHRVWRPRVLDAWQRAGFSRGQTILDIGCGPGYAALDLAGIVGPSGTVVAIDKSARFIGALGTAQKERNLTNIQRHQSDFNQPGFPLVKADAAWARWVFAFVRHPKDLLERVAGALKPGGVFVLHEYLDYSTWRQAPRLPELEEYVAAVIKSWRDEGGEPDIALQLPSWLSELGFELLSLKPLIDVVPPTNPVWEWLEAFVRVGLPRLVEIGRMTSLRAQEITVAFDARKADPGILMVSPAVLEIIALRRDPGLFPQRV